MKVAFYTKYTRKGASSRLRSYQYIPMLQKAGFTVEIKPLFDDAYLEALYSGKSVYAHLFKGYLRRWFSLFSLFKYDVVFVEYELFPYMPVFFERLFSLFNSKYVVDYDDAIFHNYDLSTNKIVRLLLKNKIDTVMRKSAYVIAGNEYLQSRAEIAGAKNIERIPTVIDTKRYSIKKSEDNNLFTIGWIGSPSTFKYLELLKPVFLELKKTHNFQITTIGAAKQLNVDVQENTLPWKEETEVDSILTFDVGVMPLEDSPWAKGKCSYKLIQYMGCGLPVIASPVGMNNEVVENGHNGFLASTNEEWLTALKKILVDPAYRRELGKHGRRMVEDNYDLKKASETLQKVFESVYKR